MLRTLTSLLCAVLLMACAAAPAPPAALPSLQPLAPAALGASRRSRQIVHAAFGEREATLQCVLSVDAQRVGVIGLTASGQRLFGLDYDGSRSTVDAGSLLPTQIPPERLLTDLQLVYWPLAAWQAATAGGDWRVSESVPGTRRLHHRERLVAEVHYAGGDPWNGRVWLSNFQFGYALTVDAQPLP